MDAKKTLTIEDIRNRYYRDIDQITFSNLIKLDPTSKLEDGVPIKTGKYTKWITKLHKKGKTLNGISKSLYKLSKLNIKNLDVSKFNSVGELDSELKNHKIENEKKTIYFENEKWIIEVPNSYEDSCALYGEKTKWCTARKDNPSFYNRYMDRGDLLVIVDKESNELYQALIEDDGHVAEFQNSKNNGSIKYENWVVDKPDILKEIEQISRAYIAPSTIYVKGRSFRYTNTDDVYVFEHVDFSHMDLTEIPKEFRDIKYIVKGTFNCSHNKLKNLIGSPLSVGGDFICEDNDLESMEGRPLSICGNFVALTIK